MSRDGVDDLLRLLPGAVDGLLRLHPRIGVDLLRLSAHEALVVLGLVRDALRVLEGCRHLRVRIGRDPLGVGDRLVVQHEELLLGVVLPPREGLLELQHPRVHLPHGRLGLGAHVGRLAGHHRPQRRRTLLSLGPDRLRLALGLLHLLGRVRGLPLETCLVRRVLRVDAQPVLVGVVLRLLDDRRGIGLRLGSHALSLLACGLEQALGLRRGVADQQARLLLRHTQHSLELLAVVGDTLFDGSAGKFRGERRHLRLGLAQLGGRRGQVGFELRVRLLLLRSQLVEGPGVVCDELLDLGLLLRAHLVERVATRLLGGGELVLIALHARRQLPDGVVDLAAFVSAKGDGERVPALT